MKTQRRTFIKQATGLLAVSSLLNPVETLASQVKSVVGKAKKPLVVFVTGDHEYSGELTLPFIAAELEKNYGMRTKVLKAYPDYNGEKDIPGLESLREADLAVFFLRWRQLPQEQLNYIDDYLKSGKPVMGFRTTTHAFNFPRATPGNGGTPSGSSPSVPLRAGGVRRSTPTTGTRVPRM